MGIVVGCDAAQEWLLPWWWKHYSAHNSYPVAFIDFGMSAQGIKWCQNTGQYIILPPPNISISLEDDIPSLLRKEWEKRYGEKFWIYRRAWFNKPFALLQCPYSLGLWLDLDCEVKGDLTPLFNYLQLGADIALSSGRHFEFTQEPIYNTGVIPFRQNAPILHEWALAITDFQDKIPSDEELLSRIIYLKKPLLIEFSPLYNWHTTFGPNPEALVYHHCGALGKLTILNQLQNS